MSRDIEAQLHDPDLLDAAPLLPHGQSTSLRSTKSIRRSQEVIQLDDIPPIIKSANGNIFWADEQCTRRVGLTSSEARLFLCLLQTDEPENYNYKEYKSLFDDFGREQERLQELVDAVAWWDVNSYRQKAIWEARIQWLERMREPRLWLLYLMARRRRILKQAAFRVLGRLREKRRDRVNGFQYQGRRDDVAGWPEGLSMMNEASQTSETQLPGTAPVMVSEESQTSETRLNVSHPRSSLTEMLRSSFSSGRHSHVSSKGHCPVFDKRFQATREDIKHQVEKLMPKQTPYLVIGWFPRSASDPLERIMQFEDPARLFRELRRGEKNVRGWRRLLSLKALRGFGLYKVSRTFYSQPKTHHFHSVTSPEELTYLSSSTPRKQPSSLSSSWLSKRQIGTQTMLYL